MKKAVAVLLIIITILSLFSCGAKYEPVPSSEEESRVVFTLKIGEEKYDVKYELYRTFFLNYRSDVDGGDPSVWTGEERDAAIARINELILDRISSVYAAFSHAKSIGIDPYSSDVNSAISEAVRIGVEGNSADIKGHGDYESYLAALKKMNMNYSVSELLLRYSLTLDAISEYYGGKVDSVLGQMPGQFEVTDEAVEEYYYSDECVRIMRLFFAKGIKTDAELQTYRADLENCSTPLDAALYIINTGCPVPPTELIKEKAAAGTTIGKYELDPAFYSEYTEAAFALDSGKVSDIVNISGQKAASHLILKLEKDTEHFELCKDEIKASYISNELGKRIHETKVTLIDSVDYTDVYSSLDHSKISMD